MNHKGSIAADGFVWALGALCLLNRIPFDRALILHQFPPPYTLVALRHALKSLGFRAAPKKIPPHKLPADALPCLAVLNAEKVELPEDGGNAIVVQVEGGRQHGLVSMIGVEIL